jgi:RNA polymerase sigma-70 factor (ECF subfamily)
MSWDAVLPVVAIPATGSGGRALIGEARFHQIYTHLAPALRGYLARIGGDAMSAEDLLQETFVRLLQADVGYLADSQLRSYLYRTATNLVRDRWRAAQRDPVVTAAAEPSAAPAIGDLDVQRLFAKLTVRERSLLWLAYVEGCDHREIAERLGFSPLGVRVSLFRARKRFAAVLEKGGLHR